MSIAPTFPRAAVSQVSSAPPSSRSSGNRVESLLLSAIGLGIAWRLVRYLLAFPIWDDEAMLCLNFLGRDLAGMLDPLDHWQVAPPLFLMTQWTSHRLLGGSEWAMRLLPQLASLGSLGLFWLLTRTVLPRRPALWATALLAVSIWPVSMGSLIKPYAGDLFWSLALTLPAAHLLWDPENRRWWGWLTAATPVALTASYPAVFIGGGVGLALTGSMLHHRRWRDVLPLGIFGTALVGSFTLVYALGVSATPEATRRAMDGYWQDGFPPGSPLPLAWWLLRTHLGEMAAYPIGAANGGSVATFLLAALGGAILWRKGQRSLVVLLLAPFALNFLAAALRRYPYGDSCRVCQHLAPAVCLLAGVGLSVWTAPGRWFRTERAALLAACLLGLVASIGIARDLVKPYRGVGDVWLRGVAAVVSEQSSPGDVLVLLEGDDLPSPSCRWRLAHSGRRVRTLREVRDEDLREADTVWALVLRFRVRPDWTPDALDPDLEAFARRLARLGTDHRPLRPREYLREERTGRNGRNYLLQYCGIHRWTRRETASILPAWAP